MIQRSKLEKASTGQEVVNLLRKEDAVKLKASGKEGQYWEVQTPSGRVSGTIPLNSHQAKNFDVAVKELTKALTSANLLQ